MAQDQVLKTINPQDGWVELTAGTAVEFFTFQVLKGPAYIRFAATQPADTAVGWLYQGGFGEAQRAVGDLSNATTSKVWGRCTANPQVLIQVEND